MLQLYGHPFSSYTWKALIAFYANEIPFEFRMVDPDHPENSQKVADHSPLGKFPLLEDGDRWVFEATSIIDYLALHFPGASGLLPSDPDAAVTTRMIDRVFDNYVMTPMTDIVAEHMRSPGMPDPATEGRARAVLDRSYVWLDRWLEGYSAGDSVTLIECAAAPSLFYADWAFPIPSSCERLRQWRAHLLSLAPVARCVDDARPYRAWFPPGAPDRD
ncbi:glutathione S-transferase family protein [Novosphingobium tardum]|uniref:Glutathione S-transferase family protein n=1 Tax=Novosphingobium tardum TaxID=1538021 RepID=A0ABV8RPQ2_9SPHN